MIGAKLECPHRILAQARAQALEQLRACFPVPDRDGEEVALLGSQRRGLFRNDPDRFDPVGQLFARKPFA